MQTNHEALWMMAVAVSWMLGHMGAPVWMPIAAASLVAISLWLDLREGAVRSQHESVA